MRYIDVHSHIESVRFEEDLDEVIQRCRDNQVVVVNSGVNPSTNKRILDIKKKYPDVVRVSFGLYPIDALAKEIETGEGDFIRDIENFDLDEALLWIENNKDECVAIGEVGLDYNYEEIRSSDELKGKQREVFRKVIDLAKKIDRPLIVHSRKAEADVMDILEEKGVKNAIIHCFMGKKSLIKRGVENGWYFSVPPVITRLEHFRMLVLMVPIEQLLTETDSPYLSPVAGERNEPSNVIVTVREIAKIKGMDEEEVRKKIIENTKRVIELIVK
jgi:TatD DNase family protein